MSIVNTLTPVSIERIGSIDIDIGILIITIVVSIIIITIARSEARISGASVPCQI